MRLNTGSPRKIAGYIYIQAYINPIAWQAHSQSSIKFLIILCISFTRSCTHFHHVLLLLTWARRTSTPSTLRPAASLGHGLPSRSLTFQTATTKTRTSLASSFTTTGEASRGIMNEASQRASKVELSMSSCAAPTAGMYFAH